MSKNKRNAVESDPQHIADNYQYWRDHGAEWGDIYTQRRRSQPYFHLQEIILGEFFESLGPASVLEVGCGVGRHLRHLRLVPELEVYGYDQSASMVANCARWATEEWLQEHVVVGGPLEPLPWPDNRFDVVFTSEVLIHVRPEDLPRILGEINRVARQRVLHLEPSPDFSPVSSEHAGCWTHDLEEVYRGIGQTCKRHDVGLALQSMYEVRLEEDTNEWEWSGTHAQRIRETEQDLQTTIDKYRGGSGLASDVAKALAEEKGEGSGQEVSKTHRVIYSLQHELGEARVEAQEADLRARATEADCRWLRNDLATVREQALDLRDELNHCIGQLHHLHAEHPLKQYLKTTWPGRLYRQWRRRRLPRTLPRDHVVVEANATAVEGTLWLTDIERPDEPPYDLTRVTTHGDWGLHPSHRSPSGTVLVCQGSGLTWFHIVDGCRLRFLSGGWRGEVKIHWEGRTKRIFFKESAEQTVNIGVCGGPDDTPNAPEVFAHTQSERGFSAAEQAWLSRASRTPVPVALIHPKWLGIRSASHELFDEVYELEDTLNPISGEHYARLFLESGCPALAIQGFPHSYLHLVEALHRLAPDFPVYCMWHGGFIQADEEYGRVALDAAQELCKRGLIRRIGFAKKGMAEVVAKSGLPTGFVMNLVRRIPSGPSSPQPGGPHVSIWASERKKPFVMLAAMRMVPEAKIHVWGARAQGISTLMRQLMLDAELHVDSMPQNRMLDMLAEMHLNLYVSLYECAPMLPLESLSVGSPCLLGPTSHYFEDAPFLRERLVVPAPDRADVIGEYARRALEEREAIIMAYRDYAPGYNERAGKSLADFLEMDLDKIWREKIGA